MKLVFSSFQATQQQWHGILRVHAVNAMSRKYRFLAQCLRYTREAVALYRPSSPIIVPFAYVTSMPLTLVVYTFWLYPTETGNFLLRNSKDITANFSYKKPSHQTCRTIHK